MTVTKRGKSFTIDWKEAVKPYRRIRQSFGQIEQKLAWKIANDLEAAYLARQVNPFEVGFRVLDWYYGKQTSQSLVLKDAVDKFLAERALYRTPRTVQAYHDILIPFMNQTHSWNHLLEDVRRREVENFLFRKHLKPKTCDSYKRHLNAFFNWAIEKELIKKNPVAGIHMPRIKETTGQKMTSFIEVTLVFDAAERYQKELATQGKDGSWIKPVIALMIYSGMRREEAVTRKRKHLINGNIFVEGMKGDRERFIPMLPELEAILNPWLEKMPKNPEAYLIQSPKKPGFPITGERVTRVFAKLREYADLPKERTIHGLRHAFITEMLSRGLNTTEVKMLAGHSSVTVTEAYAHLSVSRLREKMMRG